jgi:predicted glycogen debranching enzyme
MARSEFTTAEPALAREWLVTNGIGGFASGTVSQANTRRYHGLLVASLQPPVQRVLMVAKLEVLARYDGRTYALGSNEYAGGTLHPRGFEHLSHFDTPQGLPLWGYALADAQLRQRLWMADGHNTTYLRFELSHASSPVELELRPLCTYRDYHSHARGGWSLDVKEEGSGCKVTPFAAARPYWLRIDHGAFQHAPDWYWNFYHRAEAERGLDSMEDLFSPGIFRATLTPGEALTLTITDEAETEAGAPALERELQRRDSLLRGIPAASPSWVRRLTLAADQFIVRRAGADGAIAGRTVIAGYPWFSDWGRDTMIALPGLTVTTGRAQDAAAILRTFAEHVSDGMLPNRFPDGGEAPEYNTVDATLWYFHAIAAYLAVTDDRALLGDLYPTLCDIIRWHQRGTRYDIHVDPADGLLYAGRAGVQLTWMDAKVGDWVVTPRIGKPVEINALWHYALSHMAQWARALKDRRAAAEFEAAAARAAGHFANRFWFADGQYLYDVVDGPEGQDDGSGRTADRSLRPNQIFAVSLGTSLLSAQHARAVVDVCARELLTPVGLRSLAPSDSRYGGRYIGEPRQRDGLYHQGTVWNWLLGPYALAHYFVYGDAGQARALLEGLVPHLEEACIGSISEIMDGDAPHTPRGCFAQAWSVSETLRAYQVLERVCFQEARRVAAGGG